MTQKPFQIVCPSCCGRGTYVDWPGKTYNCYRCHKTGYLNFPGHMQCDVCNGVGYSFLKKTDCICNCCSGTHLINSCANCKSSLIVSETCNCCGGSGYDVTGIVACNRCCGRGVEYDNEICSKCQGQRVIKKEKMPCRLCYGCKLVKSCRDCNSRLICTRKCNVCSDNGYIIKRIKFKCAKCNGEGHYTAKL
jgi:hypothetical protein